MNGYLRPPDMTLTGPMPGFAPKFSQLLETHNTIVMFEAGTAVDVSKDHVECPDWFGFRQHEVQHASKPCRLGPGAVARSPLTATMERVANYLYADGHVDSITADQIEEWCDAGTNFAIPPQ